MYNLGALERKIASDIPLTHKFEITLVYSDPGPSTIKSASSNASIASSIGSTFSGSKKTRSIHLFFFGI